MPRPAPHDAATETNAPPAARLTARDSEGKEPGAAISAATRAIAVLWVIGALVSAYALIGPSIAALTPVQIAAIAAAVVLPAMMIWFAGAAARDGARARAEARRLADAADRLLHPEQSAELAAKRLAVTVRGEISALDKALETTLTRIREVEGVIAKQARAVEDMSAQAKVGASTMITGMERERAELLKISQDLTGQAQNIGDSISRHTRVINEAARNAEHEVRAADQALDHRITSFGAAAALITDRTHALSGAAQNSADSALRLEQALSNALDILAKATDLTDAARQSADQATLAANETAGAVRDTTHRAIEDAKRAADMIRGEAVNVEREAAIALERLRDAAESARAAAIGARNAAEPDRARGRAPRSEPEVRQQEARYERSEPEAPQDYAPPRRERGQDQGFGERAPAPQNGPQNGQQGAWTWRELLTSIDEDAPSEPQRPSQTPQPSRRAPASDPLERLAQTVSEPRAPQHGQTIPAADMVEQMGVRLNEVFSASALDRIAQRARSGSQARRRAVKDAAPDAVKRLGDHLARDPRANHEAMEFLRVEGARIAELLSRGRAPMSAEATRTFLLIDAAAA